MALNDGITALAQAIGADVKTLTDAIDALGGGGGSPLLTYGYLKITPNRHAHAWNYAQIQSNAFTEYQRFRAVQLRLAVANTFSTAITEVGTAAEGAVIRMGIYASNPATGLPGSLFADLGTVDASTTGLKNLTLTGNLTIPAGLYWMGSVIQGASGATMAKRYAFTRNDGTSPSGEHGPTNAYGHMLPTMSNVTGALPATFTDTGSNDMVAGFISLKGA